MSEAEQRPPEVTEALEFLEGTITSEDSEVGLPHFRAAAVAIGIPKRLGTWAFRALTGKSTSVLEHDYRDVAIGADSEGPIEEYPRVFRQLDDKYLKDKDDRFTVGRLVDFAGGIKDNAHIPEKLKNHKRVASIIAIGSIIGGVVEYNRRKEGE